LKKFTHEMLGRPILATSASEIRPVGAMGENAPALAPLTTIIDIMRADIFASPAIAMAIGAINAIIAMLPGPTAVKIIVREKMTIGNNPGFPLASFIVYFVNLSSVPIDIGLCEEQGHTYENDKQCKRKAFDDSGNIGRSCIYACYVCEGYAQETDVERIYTTDDNGYSQKDERQYC
jgi:hypothetical protein